MDQPWGDGSARPSPISPRILSMEMCGRVVEPPRSEWIHILLMPRDALLFGEPVLMPV